MKRRELRPQLYTSGAFEAFASSTSVHPRLITFGLRDARTKPLDFRQQPREHSAVASSPGPRECTQQLHPQRHLVTAS